MKKIITPLVAGLTLAGLSHLASAEFDRVRMTTINNHHGGTASITQHDFGGREAEHGEAQVLLKDFNLWGDEYARADVDGMVHVNTERTPEESFLHLNGDFALFFEHREAVDPEQCGEYTDDDMLGEDEGNPGGDEFSEPNDQDEPLEQEPEEEPEEEPGREGDYEEDPDQRHEPRDMCEERDGETFRVVHEEVQVGLADVTLSWLPDQDPVVEGIVWINGEEMEAADIPEDLKEIVHRIVELQE